MTELCGCGRFMGNDVHRVTLRATKKEKHDICARCWHAQQIRAFVGPRDGFLAHARDFYDTFRALLRPDRRWLKLRFAVSVVHS